MRRRLLERGPAVVFLEPAGSLLADVVEQALAHVFPDRLGTVEAYGIGLLDLD
jgi:hypothetical protein